MRGHNSRTRPRPTPILQATALGCLAFCLGLTTILAHVGDDSQIMTNEEREQLKDEAKDMFYHAYHAYMENAYPADELMPLSCTGRWRGTDASRGDIDDTLGNFSLTLIDSLDTLVVLGDLEEFEHAVKLVIKDVTFDNDVVVSVFETNIRVLGGLLSGHILAEYFQQRSGLLGWYRGELLDMARDLGFRLLPAFNTTTGIPHARVNLRHGMKSASLENSRETCTACAGTMILEMAALSRLSGEPIFEEKAHRAMDELWKLRHRSSDLMGTVLNVHSGDWIRRDSGVGAGIDSYYEYCLKAYILLGDERYLGRFNKHYSAVMKYISQGPMLLEVHMHRPHTNSRNFMDALLAFWPGLQVLKGDIRPAVETHEMLYQVMQRHNFLPEAFTTDFQVHWGQHPLRPEFLESTYFLYRATADPYYLYAGRSVLRSLQKYARVPCGYAAVKDVRTGIHEDRMDSFVLAETFKYLYLLFADPAELVIDLDEFLFTTEAHLLPLTLARSDNSSVVVAAAHDAECGGGVDEGEEYARSCPNTLQLFPESVRRPLKNMVDGVCPKKTARRKLLAQQFLAGNANHMQLVKNMGISIITLSDGRVQLMHTFSSAQSSSDAEEGILFMQEMVELSKVQAQSPDAPPRAVWFKHHAPDGAEEAVIIKAGPAHFGSQLDEAHQVHGRVGVADPLRACQDLANHERLVGRIVIVERGDCMFVDKARRLQAAGAAGGIVVDNTPGTAAATSPMFAMSGDGTDDVNIPIVFLFYHDATKLLQAVGRNPAMSVMLGDLATLQKETTSGAVQGTVDKVADTSNTFIDKKKHESTLDKLKDSILEFLSKKENTHKVVSESAPDDEGDFVAAVGPSKGGGDEMIRISRKSGTGDVSSIGGGEDRWVRLRQLLVDKLSNSDVHVPASVMKLYHQLLRDIDSKNDKKATHLQAAWLLAELAKLDPQAELAKLDPQAELARLGPQSDRTDESECKANVESDGKPSEENNDASKTKTKDEL